MVDKRGDFLRREAIVESRKRFTRQFARGGNIFGIGFASGLERIARGFCRGNIPALNHDQVAAEVAVEGAEAGGLRRARFQGVDPFFKIRKEIGEFFRRAGRQGFLTLGKL